MEQIYKIAGYIALAIMAAACVLLLLHYAGLIAATSPAWLWGFVWGPPVIVGGCVAVMWIVGAILSS